MAYQLGARVGAVAWLGRRTGKGLDGATRISLLGGERVKPCCCVVNNKTGAVAGGRPTGGIANGAGSSADAGDVYV